MKKIRTYLAVVTNGRKAYICEAYNKKQMKTAGMNMKLEWMEKEDIGSAKHICRCNSFEIIHIYDVSNFKNN